MCAEQLHIQGKSVGFEAVIDFAKDGVRVGAHHTLPVCLSRAFTPKSAWEPLFVSAQVQKYLSPVLPWSGAISSASSQIMFCILLLPEAFPPLPCVSLKNMVI